MNEFLLNFQEFVYYLWLWDEYIKWNKCWNNYVTRSGHPPSDSRGVALTLGDSREDQWGGRWGWGAIWTYIHILNHILYYL